MNIFVLDKRPKECAMAHADIHVVKMILETAQILSTVLRAGNYKPRSANGVPDFQGEPHAPTVRPTWSTELYRATHPRHPCVKWAASDPTNYMWLRELGLELCKEYTWRYGRVHASQRVIAQTPEFNFAPIPVEFVYCGAPEYRVPDVVQSYRRYYVSKRGTMQLRYTRRLHPQWFVDLVGDVTRLERNTNEARTSPQRP